VRSKATCGMVCPLKPIEKQPQYSSTRARQDFPPAGGGSRRSRPAGPDLRMRGLAMSDTTESDDERPCLHCLIGDVIDDFYAEYGSLSGEKDALDGDQIITAPPKTVAPLTFRPRSP